MKISVLAGLLLCSSLMAEDNGFYLGVEAGISYQKNKESYRNTFLPSSNYDENLKNKSASYGINLGYYFNANNRAYAFYQYISKGDYASHTNAYGAGYDYLFGDSSLKPFVGALIGYSTFRNGDFNPKGMAYGGQIGVNYKITDNFSMDTGYRYLISDSESVETTPTTVFTSEGVSFQSFFLGANYKF